MKPSLLLMLTVYILIVQLTHSQDHNVLILQYRDVVITLEDIKQTSEGLARSEQKYELPESRKFEQIFSDILHCLSKVRQEAVKKDNG